MVLAPSLDFWLYSKVVITMPCHGISESSILSRVVTGLTVITCGDTCKGRKLYTLPLLTQSIQAIRHATSSKGKVSEAASK